MTDEWTIGDGLGVTAEMIKDYFTYMVFDTVAPAAGATAPTTEVIRKIATGIVDGQNIVWTATIAAGDFTEDTVIRGIFMCGVDGEEVDHFLCGHKITPQTVNASYGLTYDYPFSVSGYLEEYDSE